MWAASIFTSRGFDSTLAFPNSGLDQFAVLYPVVDSLNHDSNAKVDWGMGLQAFTLSTFETLKVGQEVYNNYGSKGNEECGYNGSFILLQLVSRFELKTLTKATLIPITITSVHGLVSPPYCCHIVLVRKPLPKLT